MIAHDGPCRNPVQLSPGWPIMLSLRFHRRFPFAGEPLGLGDLLSGHQRRG